MKKEEILNEVQTSSWQPQFTFTDDLDQVVDSILEPHEDYFLGLHSKVKEIIEREIKRLSGLNFGRLFNPRDSKITFADVCNWQKELFEYKEKIWAEQVNEAIDNKWMGKVVELKNLPNRYINLGLRTTNVKVGEWTPPHPMFLEDLKEMCFPVISSNISELATQSQEYYDVDFEEYIKESLTEWYKIFETIHFFEDLNGRLGGIVINILSYIMTGKYLIKNV